MGSNPTASANLPEAMWAVYFKDHIHTDCYGQFAIFRSKKEAMVWLKKYGIPGCKLERTL